MKLFLAAWIAVFACQSAGVVALAVPDDCIDVVGNTGGDDSCPEGCARCVCCARIPASASPVVVCEPIEPPVLAAMPPVIDFFSSASPRGILHIPKTR